MSGLADATKCEKCGQPGHKALGRLGMMPDVNVFAAPDQEFWVYQSNDSCERSRRAQLLTAANFGRVTLRGSTLVTRRGQKNERDVNIPESESGARCFPIR